MTLNICRECGDVAHSGACLPKNQRKWDIPANMFDSPPVRGYYVRYFPNGDKVLYRCGPNVYTDASDPEGTKYYGPLPFSTDRVVQPDVATKPEGAKSVDPAIFRAMIDAATKLIRATVLKLIEDDPHSWSTRPCQTCKAVSTITGEPFGCTALRAKEGR